MTDREDTTYINTIDREYAVIADEILDVVRQPDAWIRRLQKINVGGFGVTQYDWYEQKDVGAIKVSMDGDEESIDIGFISVTSPKIPVFSKDIYVKRRQLETSRRPPLEPVNLRAQKTIAGKLQEKMDEVIGLGITLPMDVNPINQDIQDGGGGAVGWDTVASIVSDTNLNLSTLLADKHYGPYYTMHYATLKGALMQLVGNTAATYEDYVNRIATLGTDYTVNTSLTTGTAATGATATQTMIEPVTRKQLNFALLVAQDWTTEDLSAGRFGLRMKLYGAMIHEVFRANAGSVVDNCTDLAN